MRLEREEQAVRTRPARPAHVHGFIEAIVIVIAGEVFA
jgi:hypothetical protein